MPVASGPSVGVTPSGSVDVAQLLEDELPREVVVGAVRERQLDHREAEDRARAARDHVRHVVERALDGNRDLLLDLLARVAGVDRDDHDAGVRDVGIGFDLELLEGPEPERDEAEAEHQRQEPVVERVRKQARHGESLLTP